MTIYEENLKTIKTKFPELLGKIIYADTIPEVIELGKFLKKYNLIHQNWLTIPYREITINSKYVEYAKGVIMDGTTYVVSPNYGGIEGIHISKIKKYIKTITYPDE